MSDHTALNLNRTSNTAIAVDLLSIMVWPEHDVADAGKSCRSATRNLASLFCFEGVQCIFLNDHAMTDGDRTTNPIQTYINSAMEWHDNLMKLMRMTNNSQIVRTD